MPRKLDDNKDLAKEYKDSDSGTNGPDTRQDDKKSPNASNDGSSPNSSRDRVEDTPGNDSDVWVIPDSVNKRNPSVNEVGLKNLSTLAGITRLRSSKIPKELIARTQSRWYEAKQFYQVDNTSGWKAYSSKLYQFGNRETWVFYACPASIAGKVLKNCRIQPYSEFFPRVLGENAIYLFKRASEAARVAFKFGVEKEGLIISCRLITGKIYRTVTGAPKASRPPKGYDSVYAATEANLGNGPIEGDIFVTYNADNVLMRYISCLEQR